MQPARAWAKNSNAAGLIDPAARLF